MTNTLSTDWPGHTSSLAAHDDPAIASSIIVPDYDSCGPRISVLEGCHPFLKFTTTSLAELLYQVGSVKDERMRERFLL